MGLTINYELSSDIESPTETRELLESLRTKALTLNFAEVGDIECFDELDTRELKAEVERTGFGAPAFFLCQASCMAQDEGLRATLGEQGYHEVLPVSFMSFSVNPGEGCETACFGLSRMPDTTEHEGVAWPTGLSRWHWQSFCKTQYASNPKFGGLDHFLRCHLGLIELLDRADELGILHRVNDESGYWEDRDRDKLRGSLEAMNRLVASFVGAFKDATDANAVAPITDFPNFEHLEADQMNSRDQEEN